MNKNEIIGAGFCLAAGLILGNQVLASDALDIQSKLIITAGFIFMSIGSAFNFRGISK